jgi:hypothetical protein
MPPLQALVALHGLWVLVLLPFGVWAVRNWPPPRLRLVGYGLSVLGLAGLAILVARDLLTWYPNVAPAQQRYVVQRALYVLGTTTDLPVVQILAAGVAFGFAARRRMRRA